MEVGREPATVLTIDGLAAAAGTTTRRIRSLQTLGLLPHPELRGRTGLYDRLHRDRLTAILALQERGFSLESLMILFDALHAGRSLADVLGVPAPAPAEVGVADGEADSAELYGFSELQPSAVVRRLRRPLLSVIPTTVWDERAS
ncbi:MAG TPA: MerR family transcriptional regulator [Acidimicrobiales bacterium]